MRLAHALLVLLAAALLCAGCAKKQITKTEQASSSAGDLLDPFAEEADSELRDVILALRRVHFGFDSVELNEVSRSALEEAASKLKPKDAVHLWVEGHADERGETEYNVGLAEKRAKVVQDYLARLGVAPDRLHVLSFGEEKPLVDRKTDEAYAANRRVDFKLMKGDIQIVLEPAPVVQ